MADLDVVRPNEKTFQKVLTNTQNYDIIYKKGETKMIYCGYQGCGKSTYCRTHKNTVDLDSSAFKKTENWEKNYVDLAKKLSDNNKVFISAHKKVIEYLINNNIEFELIIPQMDKLLITYIAVI